MLESVIMKKQTYKIGQEIQFIEDFEIEKVISKEKVQVKKGDTAVITSHGTAIHTKGQARGMIQCLSGVNIEGYDHENIAKMILQRLINVYNLEEFMEYEEIGVKEIIDEIEDVLCEILQINILDLMVQETKYEINIKRLEISLAFTY